MDVVLKNLVGTECWVCIDDVIIFSRSAKEHAQRLENVLQRFDKTILQLNTGKCMFSQSRVNIWDLCCLNAVFQFLINYVIQINHGPDYIARPEMKRTFDLVSLSYWLPGMRECVADYIRRCDACQRRKEDREFLTPLGEMEKPTAPFQVTSMDVTCSYLMIPRRNKYLLAFIGHFTKYFEAFPIPDQTAETFARVYTTQIITRHGTGSTLITDQGRPFISSFFKESRLNNFKQVLPKLDRRRDLVDFGGTDLKTSLCTAIFSGAHELHEVFNELQRSQTDVIHSISKQVTHMTQ